MEEVTTFLSKRAKVDSSPDAGFYKNNSLGESGKLSSNHRAANHTIGTSRTISGGKGSTLRYESRRRQSGGNSAGLGGLAFALPYRTSVSDPRQLFVSLLLRRRFVQNRNRVPCLDGHDQSLSLTELIHWAQEGDDGAADALFFRIACI